jgi:hypothetical protein
MFCHKLCCLYIISSSDRDLETRNKLRNEFWSTIDSYLDALECPKEGYYLLKSSTRNGGVAYWRHDPSLRSRVVYWIISCATSELHAEKLHPNEQVGVVTATPTTPMETEIIPATKQLLLPELDPSVFPLGFSTGDNQVDQLLVLLQMNLLQQVEQEQQQYNQLLADSIILLETNNDCRDNKKHQSKQIMSRKKSGRQRGRR